LFKSKATRDLFEKEFDYKIPMTGTAKHHQNGVVESANQTIGKAMREMLIRAGLAVKFWPYALDTSCVSRILPCLAGMQPNQPIKELHGVKDDFSLLKTFGCHL